jgi:UDP-galactopyranose mutase
LVEFSKATEPADVPYYPIRKEADKALLREYRELAAEAPGVSFLGRLGTYRYLDMDDVIGEALAFARAWLQHRADPQVIAKPKFSHNPVAAPPLVAG